MSTTDKLFLVRLVRGAYAKFSWGKSENTRFEIKTNTHQRLHATHTRNKDRQGKQGHFSADSLISIKCKYKCELDLTVRSYMNCRSICFRTHNSSRQSDNGCKTDEPLFSMLHSIFSMICFDARQPRPVIKEKCQHVNAKSDLCMMPCS